MVTHGFYLLFLSLNNKSIFLCQLKQDKPRNNKKKCFFLGISPLPFPSNWSSTRAPCWLRLQMLLVCLINQWDSCEWITSDGFSARFDVQVLFLACYHDRCISVRIQCQLRKITLNRPVPSFPKSFSIPNLNVSPLIVSLYIIATFILQQFPRLLPQ